MPLIREAISALDPVARVSDVLTMEETLARTRWTSRTFATMLGVFASIALLLSVVGLYAVTAYTVSQRTQEIGLRMALGARPRQVWWLMLRGCLLQLTIGVVLGLAGAVAAGRLLRNTLVQLEPTDPLTLTSIVIVLVTAGVIASFWPARRATQLDPAIALRYE
jgi:ABC-type antimicrobial peptide transport system permease subunit